MGTETADPEAWQPVNEILHQQDKGELLRKVQEAELHTHTHSHKYMHIHTLTHPKGREEKLQGAETGCTPCSRNKAFWGMGIAAPKSKAPRPWLGRSSLGSLRGCCSAPRRPRHGSFTDLCVWGTEWPAQGGCTVSHNWGPGWLPDKMPSWLLSTHPLLKPGNCNGVCPYTDVECAPILHRARHFPFSLTLVWAVRNKRIFFTTR